MVVFWCEAAEQFWSKFPDSTFDFWSNCETAFGFASRINFDENSAANSALDSCVPATRGEWSAPALDPLEAFQVLTVGMFREGEADEYNWSKVKPLDYTR